MCFLFQPLEMNILRINMCVQVRSCYQSFERLEQDFVTRESWTYLIQGNPRMNQGNSRLTRLLKRFVRFILCGDYTQYVYDTSREAQAVRLQKILRSGIDSATIFSRAFRYWYHDNRQRILPPQFPTGREKCGGSAHVEIELYERKR